jgi:hypothetical protein
MKLLIKFPTRGRKSKFFEVLYEYIDLLDDVNNTYFLITLDKDDKEMYNQDTIDKLKKIKNLSYFFGKSENKVSAINRDLKSNDNWDILLLASDDMIPQIKGYDSVIRDNMTTHFPDTDGVLWFNDGNRKDLNTLSILGKKYYQRFNYIYNPEYKSTWCDNEFTQVANILKKQIFIDQVIIKHEHPDWGFGVRDEIHRQNLDNEFHDKSVYLKNSAINFNL